MQANDFFQPGDRVQRRGGKLKDQIGTVQEYLRYSGVVYVLWDGKKERTRIYDNYIKKVVHLSIREIGDVD